MDNSKMKKINLIIIAGFLLFIILLVVIIMIRNSQPSAPPEITPPSNRPTATPIITQPQPDLSLQILSTDPKSGATSVSLDQAIKIQLSKSYPREHYDFTIGPSAEFTVTADNSIVIVNPKTSWVPGATYTYSLSEKGIPGSLPQTFTFTTAGPTVTAQPDTFPSGAAEEEEENLRRNNPDIYLKEKTPYENYYILVSSDFRSLPADHFYFTVSSKMGSRDQAKSEFEKWALSLKLTPEQIKGLDVSY